LRATNVRREKSRAGVTYQLKKMPGCRVVGKIKSMDEVEYAKKNVEGKWERGAQIKCLAKQQRLTSCREEATPIKNQRSWS